MSYICLNYNNRQFNYGYKWKLRHWCIENERIGRSMLYNKK